MAADQEKKFTDLFIRRPVLATVISLLILLLGLRSMLLMPVQQYPTMNSAMISISTVYPGASADVVQGFITSIISQAVSGADGVDYLSSISQQNSSNVSVYVRLGADADKAMTSVMSKVSSVQGQLPRNSEAPSVSKQSADQTGLMYIGFTAPNVPREQLYDYLSRAVQPVLETQPGVAFARLLGSGSPAMRIWLDPRRMAALNVTTNDVMQALQNNNYQSSAGVLKGKYIQLDIDAQTLGTDAKTFSNLVVRRTSDGSQITIGDVTNSVKMGPENTDVSVVFNKKKAVFIGIFPAPGANPLDISAAINKVLPGIEKNFPNGFHAKVTYDATKYISASIKEVFRTIIEATLIVMVIIFLFLGSLRTVIVPVVTIPLSLIGVCSLMLALGFSLNLMTLLAMVLAIGMVVDDAIVVVENIYRHVEEGMAPMQAAIVGTREIAMPVISMSLTLAAVFAPIGFMGGLTGNLFREFAFTLAAAVIISGVVALTLSPMMCSRILTKNIGKGRLVRFLDQLFDNVHRSYERMLTASLYFRPVSIVFCLLVLLLSVGFLFTTPQELAPQEDQGFMLAVAQSPKYANIDYTEHYTQQFGDIFASFPFTQDAFTINGFSFGNTDVTSAFSGIVLKPWDQRKTSVQQAQQLVQAKLNNIPGIQAMAVPLPPLPGVSGFPVEFVITSLGNYKQLVEVAKSLQAKAMKSGNFIFLKTDADYSKPNLALHIDRKKAADLGITMSQIGSTLAGLYGENYINRFNLDSQSYKVIPLVLQKYRLGPKNFDDVYLRTENNQLVPLSSIVSVKITSKSNAIYQYQQLNSVTLQGMVRPPNTIGDALTYLQTTLQQDNPSGYGVGYTGASRQYIEAGSSILVTFALAMIIIFLVLAAQFESFRDPLIILIAVPLSTFGALFFLNIGFATMNIYTEIGLVTLIGLISKHGILMTEFANKLQVSEGLTVRDAIIKSAGVRLRPILMTTAAMIFGVLPLVLSTGPGAKSRFDIGLVILTGMTIGTCFTLFIVPMVYSFLAKRHTAV